MPEIEELLHIAEGSDWFWWYGRENYTPDIDIFDSLFRQNLQKIYEILGQPRPEALPRPIPVAAPADRLHVVPPQDCLEARIDGETSDYFEWLDAGRIDILSYGGAMNIANPMVKTLFFGFDHDHVFLRIDTKKDARTYFENRFFAAPAPAMRSRELAGRDRLQRPGTGNEGYSPGGAAAVGGIIECRIPLAALGASAGDDSGCRCTGLSTASPSRPSPPAQPLTFRVPGARDYAAYWQV